MQTTPPINRLRLLPVPKDGSILSPAYWKAGDEIHALHALPEPNP
jgi:hypothetical protein